MPGVQVVESRARSTQFLRYLLLIDNPFLNRNMTTFSGVYSTQSGAIFNPDTGSDLNANQHPGI